MVHGQFINPLKGKLNILRVSVWMYDNVILKFVICKEKNCINMWVYISKNNFSIRGNVCHIHTRDKIIQGRFLFILGTNHHVVLLTFKTHLMHHLTNQ